MKLTLASIAKDEEVFLPGMLESIKGLVDEVVLGVDDKTTDRTGQIATDYGAQTVFQFTWRNDFSYARNLALDRATGDWTLVIDPDEAVTPHGVMVIKDIMARDKAGQMPYHGFRFLEAQLDLDGTLQVVTPTSVRLFRNIPEIRYRGIVHEEPWDGRGESNWCDVAGVVVLTHMGYDPNVLYTKQKHERNLKLLQERIKLEPDNDYVRRKLASEMSMDEYGHEVK